MCEKGWGVFPGRGHGREETPAASPSPLPAHRAGHLACHPRCCSHFPPPASVQHDTQDPSSCLLSRGFYSSKRRWGSAAALDKGKDLLSPGDPHHWAPGCVIRGSLLSFPPVSTAYTIGWHRELSRLFRGSRISTPHFMRAHGNHCPASTPSLNVSQSCRGPGEQSAGTRARSSCGSKLPSQTLIGHPGHSQQPVGSTTAPTAPSRLRTSPYHLQSCPQGPRKGVSRPGGGWTRADRGQFKCKPPAPADPGGSDLSFSPFLGAEGTDGRRRQDFREGRPQARASVALASRQDPGGWWERPQG